MKGASMPANKAIKSMHHDLHSWLCEASKEERIEMAKQIASTVEKSDDEISYFDTANLEDMSKEERLWLAKKIASSIPHVRGGEWGRSRSLRTGRGTGWEHEGGR